MCIRDRAEGAQASQPSAPADRAEPPPPAGAVTPHAVAWRGALKTGVSALLRVCDRTDGVTAADAITGWQDALTLLYKCTIKYNLLNVIDPRKFCEMCLGSSVANFSPDQFSTL